MTRPIRFARVLTVVVSLLLLVAAAGCRPTATAPTPADSGAETGSFKAPPPVLQIGADGSASFVTLPPSAWTDPYSASSSLQTYDRSRQLSSSVSIDGTLGGRVVCGRYVLTVPPGAFVGVGTVTMTLPDSTLMLCDLDIAPASLNGFLVPLDLSLHTFRTTTQTDSVDFYWWDPATGSWTSMGAQQATSLDAVFQDELLTADTVAGVRLPLNHFSRYMAGKAGW